jgi:hypothetical protein
VCKCCMVGSKPREMTLDGQHYMVFVTLGGCGGIVATHRLKGEIRFRAWFREVAY